MTEAKRETKISPKKTQKNIWRHCTILRLISEIYLRQNSSDNTQYCHITISWKPTGASLVAHAKIMHAFQKNKNKKLKYKNKNTWGRRWRRIFIRSIQFNHGVYIRGYSRPRSSFTLHVWSIHGRSHGPGMLTQVLHWQSDTLYAVISSGEAARCKSTSLVMTLSLFYFLLHCWPTCW